ncbi:hypothetical protein HDU99_006394, partial [Rhizoclosmatium hyalinum]
MDNAELPSHPINQYAPQEENNLNVDQPRTSTGTTNLRTLPRPTHSHTVINNTKQQLEAFLESHHVHWTVILLTLADMVITFLEIVSTFTEQCAAEQLGESSVVSSSLSLLHTSSTAILIFFAIEIGARFYASGINYFLSDGLHLLDAFVVFVSLAIDLFMEGWMHRVMALLIVARAWRVVRVVGAAVNIIEEENQ